MKKIKRITLKAAQILLTFVLIPCGAVAAASLLLIDRIEDEID